MSDYFGVGVFYLVLIIVIQSIVGSYFASKKIRYFHETGVAIVLGMTLSAVAYFGFNYTVQLEKTVFLYVFLPAIIFSEGYSMKKRHFFKNMSYILTYGLLGTVISFITMLALVSVLCNNEMVQINLHGQNDGEDEPYLKYVDLNVKEITLFSAALSSKDSFLASTMVDHHSYPVLFHVIFGEGIINDATSLILFDSFETLVDEDINSLQWSMIPKIIVIMLKSVSISISVGVFFGIVCTLILKHFSFLNKTVVHEVLIIFMSSYSSYCLVEAFHYSGVISLLFSGIIIGHYAFYNLSEKGKMCSNVVFQTLSSGAENFLFAYLGFVTFSFYRYSWSFTLIGWVILILIVGRFITVFVMSAILRIFFKKGTFAMNLREQIVLQFTGISRGILGYILIDQVESEDYQDVLNSTVLGVLITTTLFFGLINPKLIDLVLPPAHHGHGHGHGEEHHNEEKANSHSDLDKKIDNISKTLGYHSQHDEDDEGHHDHHEGEDEQIRKKKITQALLYGEFDEKLFKSKWSYKLQRFNAKYVKPFMIRDYYGRFDEIVISKELFKEDKYELMRPDGFTKDQQLIRQSIQMIKNNIKSQRIPKSRQGSAQHDKVGQIIEEANSEQEEDKLDYDEDAYLDKINKLGIIKASINQDNEENESS